MVAEFAVNALIPDRTDLVGLLREIQDIPSTCMAMRRLVAALTAASTDEAIWGVIKAAVRDNELGRLLRTDPMVLRCQWRQPATNPYDVVESFIMGWADTAGALAEAEAPGSIVNGVFAASGIGGAFRERRDMVRGFLADVPPGGRVLALGAGRAPEIDQLAPRGALDIGRWLGIDPASDEDPGFARHISPRVERRVDSLERALAVAARRGEIFDLVYTVDAIDSLTDEEAVALLAQAATVLSPNGRLMVSAFAPDLPEAAYLDAVLDWRPRLRDELLIGQLLADADEGAIMKRSVWRGGSDRVVFGLLERQSWAT